ncbi:hypothetical protein GF407_08340 [candidate division KSB1 bacterium]|nr:hypothetical protein [candidate division KSB1 bacterium]
METLSKNELKKLIQSVFPPLESDKQLYILVDLPKSRQEELAAWNRRRNIAFDWYGTLAGMQAALGIKPHLVAYINVGSNNADLPENGYIIEEAVPQNAEILVSRHQPQSFSRIFTNADIVIALTQFSATAPLKLAAKVYDFRAATMPGFSEKMIPALRIDYNLVNDRVNKLKNMLDDAKGARVHFIVDKNKSYEMYFDLRYRSAHASGGRFPSPGTAGNLPSGEAYIVPYEGEKDSQSLTAGTLPVQFDNDLVFYHIEQNRARVVSGNNKRAISEELLLKNEPAYGNMAELGFGILYDFGLKAIGEVLLDEKLGFHIAFGRSDHFDGYVGPQQFSSPENVVHIDRIYLHDIQPRITVSAVELEIDKKLTLLIDNGRYTVF